MGWLLDLCYDTAYKLINTLKVIKRHAFDMAKLKKFLFIAIALGLVGGGLFLITWDIPAPSEKVTKTVDNNRFPS